MKLSEANVLAAAAFAVAEGMDVNIGVVITDSAGQVLVAQRGDNAYLTVLNFAEHKAFTAVNFRRPTHEMANRIGSFEFSNHLALVDRRLIFIGGGAPIYRSQMLLGGIGISGASADQDLEICTGAIAKCGFSVSPQS